MRMKVPSPLTKAGKGSGKAKADKPIKLTLPHPLAKLEDVELCLITKDPQREYKDKLAAQRCDGRVKVSGMDKLRKKYAACLGFSLLGSCYDIEDACFLPILWNQFHQL